MTTIRHPGLRPGIHKNKVHSDFWQQVNQRINENKTIMQSGFSPKLAPSLAWVGLHFWIIGGLLSLGLTLWLFTQHYSGLMQAIRIIIWR